jgi:SAM-dependent methyltransferase
VSAAAGPVAATGGLPPTADGLGDIQRQSPQGAPVVFPEHRLAHELLDGLRGLEIGAAAYNPFGLDTRNVATREGHEFYIEEQRALGVEPAPIDIWASGDAIPVPDRSEDFVISSHVVEHMPNLVRAFLEWDRIVRDGGYVYMIVPLKGALPQDAGRELTSLDHFIECHRQGFTLDTHPVDDVPGGRMGHYHTFTADSLTDLVDWMRESGLCQWELIAREDVDSKVGNGFTLVFRVTHADALATPRGSSPCGTA